MGIVNASHNWTEQLGERPMCSRLAKKDLNGGRDHDRDGLGTGEYRAETAK
jgi:hypothetical protein